MRVNCSWGGLRKLIGGCLFGFAICSVAQAQQQNDDIAPGVISGTSTFASPYSNGLWGEYFPRVSVQHRTEGAGYDYSFTDFRGWVPLYESHDSKSLTYFDGAFLLSNDRNVGMNAVVGQRFYFDELDRTFGGFVGYDNRDTGAQTVGQVVAGFESLGKIDFRANGYFPTDTSPVGTGTSFIDPTYVGYNIQLTQLDQYQVAMKGFDAEVGGALPKIGDYVRAYLGLYNFQGEGSPQAWGWKTRFESHVTDRMRLYLTVTDDQVFNTNVVFGAAFFFPTSSARRVPRYDSFVNKMDEPLVRNEAVVVNNFDQYSTLNATNPTTGAAQQVIHVDPNATAAGDGTVENPYNTLAAAQAGSQPNDIIFVRPRADNTATNLTQDLTLQDNQRLLGSTTQHQFTATQGTFDLPGYEAGNRPTLDSTGVAVRLANNNEVSGFRFDDTGNDSIDGNGITGFNINNNLFEAYGAFGHASIDTSNVGGTVVIRDNQIFNTAADGDLGMLVQLNDTSNVLITGNTINRQISAGGGNGLRVSVPAGVNATVNITNNVVTNSVTSAGTGIFFGSNGNVTGNITGNEILVSGAGSGTPRGIYAQLQGSGTNSLTIDDNQIGTFATAGTVTEGILVLNTSTGYSYVAITNNEISDRMNGTAIDFGISYNQNSAGTHDLVLSGNQISHSVANAIEQGVLVQNGFTGTLNVNAFDNVVNATTSNNDMRFVAALSGDLNLRMVNNVTSGNVRVGANGSGDLYFEVFGGQPVPNPLVASDVSSQNSIGGTVILITGGSAQNIAVAPGSLPIPD